MTIRGNLCTEDTHESTMVKLFSLLPVVTTGTDFTPTKFVEQDEAISNDIGTTSIFPFFDGFSA